jgi:hypothetical protein|tara:strand:- start:215 stop:502 length:288 start_codon:yes stop_codon:yes gene_type:complete
LPKLGFQEQARGGITPGFIPYQLGFARVDFLQPIQLGEERSLMSTVEVVYARAKYNLVLVTAGCVYTGNEPLCVSAFYTHAWGENCQGQILYLKS